jgi:hypothetical protein
MEDQAFWRDIFGDHAKFLELGLIEPTLKAEAKSFRALFQQPGIKLTETVYQLTNFKRKLLKLQSEGTFIGFLYSSFIKHMLSEANYYLELMQGNVIDLPYFWINHADEVLKLTQQTFDPAQIEQIIDVATKEEKFSNILHTEYAQVKAVYSQAELLRVRQLLTEFGSDATKLKDAIRTGKVNSLLNVEMVQHEIQENDYALRKLAIRSSH